MSNVPSKTTALRWGGLASSGSNNEEDLLQIQSPQKVIQGWIDSSGTPWGNLASPGTASPTPSNVVFASTYGATANGQFVYDAVSNGTKTITSATANFTQADVGKVVFGVDNTGVATSPPQGIITAVNSASSITVSNIATASKTAVALCWGTDDTAACAAAWSAALAANQYLVLPAGYILVQTALFNDVSGADNTKNYGLMSDGFSSLVPTPNFDFTTAPFSTSGLFFDCGSQLNVDSFPNNNYITNVGVYGGNQTLSGNATTNAIFNLEQCKATNLWAWSWGNLAQNLIAVQCGPVVILDGCYIDTAGGIGVKVNSPVTQQTVISGNSYVTNNRVLLSVGPNSQVQSYSSYWGPSTVDPGITTSAGSIFNSYGDVFAGSSGTTNARAVDANGIVTIDSAYFFSNANEFAINVKAGASVFVSKSVFNLTAVGAQSALVAATGIYVDDGTNTFVAGTPAVITAANITPSTGWGTSGAAGNGVSAVSGDARCFQFTITSAGSPSPNPTIAIVFPWTLPRVPIVIVQQVGGTGAIEPVTISTAATQTGVTLTWNGTPAEPKTFIFNCISE